MTALTGRAAVAILAVLFIASAADGQTLTLQGQLSSWFILADSQPSSSVAGVRYLPTLSIEQQLSDYRDVEGLKMPFLIKRLANGAEQAKIQVEKVELNPGYAILNELEIVGSAGASRADVERVLGLAASGELVPALGGTLPLERAEEAHAALRSRAATGRLVLVP